MSDTAQGPGWWQASDGKWYPPEQAPGYAAPPPPPGAGAPAFGPPPGYGTPPPMAYAPAPASGMSGCLKAFLIVLAIVGVLSVVGVIVAVTVVDDAVDDFADDVNGTDAGELDDVEDIVCDTDAVGDLHATVTVVNDSSERSNYIITVAFEDDDGVQLDTGTAFINAVEPDQEASGDAVTFTDPPANGDFDCRVASLERFSDLNGND